MLLTISAVCNSCTVNKVQRVHGKLAACPPRPHARPCSRTGSHASCALDCVISLASIQPPQRVGPCLPHAQPRQPPQTLLHPAGSRARAPASVPQSCPQAPSRQSAMAASRAKTKPFQNARTAGAVLQGTAPALPLARARTWLANACRQLAQTTTAGLLTAAQPGTQSRRVCTHILLAHATPARPLNAQPAGRQRPQSHAHHAGAPRPKRRRRRVCLWSRHARSGCLARRCWLCAGAGAGGIGCMLQCSIGCIA